MKTIAAIAAKTGTPVVRISPMAFIIFIGKFSPAPIFAIIDFILGSMKNRNNSTTAEARRHRKIGYASAEIIVCRNVLRAFI